MEADTVQGFPVMRKLAILVLSGLLGAGLMTYVSGSDWRMAAAMGAALGMAVALFVFVYPADLASPAESRRERPRPQAGRAVVTKANFKPSDRS